MPIPKFEAFFFAVLNFLKDGKDRTVKEVADNVADEFGLSEEERTTLLASGNKTVVFSRVGWARTFLKKAELVEYPKKGMVRITDSGLKFLEANPASFTLNDLRAIPAFERNWNVHPDETSAGKAEVQSVTPQERMEKAFAEIQEELIEELLEQIGRLSPTFFERLVVDLLLKMGYGGSSKDAGRAIGRTGDGGIDGIIKEDKLGLDAIYIQAKRWEGVVGRPEIQKFMGALAGNRAKKGVFITTSDFTNEARQYASSLDVKLILVDGRQLAELMIEHGVGVSDETAFRIMKVDADYFIEE